MSNKNFNKTVIKLFFIVSILFILVLSISNIKTCLKPRETVKVLGAETQVAPEETFWQNFLTINPTYIPGWEEIGRMDKVKEIDPNY